MNEAIKSVVIKAISGGFKDPTPNGNIYKITQDPLFWQALGKALGWFEWAGTDEFNNDPQWQYHAHQYFDLVLTDNRNTDYICSEDECPVEGTHVHSQVEKFWQDLIQERNNQ